MSKVLELNSKSFKTEVLESKVPVLVDFWASWCMPCKMMLPILEEVAEALDGKVKITKLSTEEPDNAEIVGKYGIQSIPNMKLFVDGKEIADFVGMRSKEVLQEDIEKAIK